MAKRVKVILIPKGKAEKICNELNIGRTTLYEALNYHSNSDSAKNTRKRVLEEWGGVDTYKTIL